MAKAAFAKGGAGFGAIEVREIEVPTPGEGEALVRLRAATLNFRDLLFAKGIIANSTKEPEYVPLSCATGEVISVGPGVTTLKPGDRVNPTFFQGVEASATVSGDMLGGTVDGVARTHGCFPAISLVPVPDEIGDLEAATFACAGLTAWTAVMGVRPIQPGEWILAQGTGGVSLAALQWAKAAGANVAITSSSDAKLARAKAMGADVIVNYRTSPDWAAEVRAGIGGGVDIVVDVAGKVQLERSASLINEGGVLTAIGMLDGDFNWTAEIGRTVFPISVGSRDAHEAMIAFAKQHRIRPVVDVVYDLDRIQDALHCLEGQGFFGKVGINLN